MYTSITGFVVPDGFVDMLIKREYQPRLDIQLTLKSIENEMKIDKAFLFSEAKKVYNKGSTSFKFRDIFLLDLISNFKKNDRDYLDYVFGNNSQKFQEIFHKIYVNQLKLEYDYWRQKHLPKLHSLKFTRMM